MKDSKYTARGVAILAAAVIMGSGFAGSALAQSAASGTITGIVTDQSGAAVPDASLLIHNTNTGVDRSVSTNGAGVYTAAFLQPGPYEVTVTKTGFAKMVRSDLGLQVGQTLSLDFKLPVQTNQQTVEVTAEAPIVDAEKTEQSQVISETAVSNLPIAGRRWDSFVLLTPNVTTDGTSGLVSYRGISGLYNSNTVDGANNNQALFSEARGRAISGAYVFSMDSIKEYQVSSSNYSAELGQAAGGVVNAVTKCGTNTLHGDLFYYLRYPTWNALDPLPKSQGIYSQPIHQWQQFGASAGGPLIKDKLFIFGTYDGSRKVNPVTYTSSTYSASVRALPCPTQVSSAQCANANAFLAGQIGGYPRATNQDVALRPAGLPGIAGEPHQLVLRLDELRARPTPTRRAPSNSNLSLGTNGSYVFHERIFVTNWDATSQPQRDQQPALPVGARPGSGRIQRARALRQPSERDGVRRELRAAAHSGTGRASHPDFRQCLVRPRPAHVQDRHRPQHHSRGHDQPVQRAGTVYL